MPVAACGGSTGTHTMFSPWWIPTAESRPSLVLHDNADTLANYPKKGACTSFQLSASKGVPLPQLRKNINPDPPQLLQVAASNNSSLVEDGTNASESARPLTRGEYCKVVNLRIPLPSCRPGGRGGLRKEGGAGSEAISSSRRSYCQQAEKSQKTNVPKLKQLEFVVFGDDLPSPDHAPKSRPSTSQLGPSSGIDPLHASSFLASLVQHRELSSVCTTNDNKAPRKDFSPPSSPSLKRPGGLPRRPHPSTVYPDLSLSSMKLHACTPPATPAKGAVDQPASMTDGHDCIFKYSHRGQESYSEGLEHLADVRLLPPPSLLVGNYRHPRSGHSKSSLGHSQHYTELPPLSSPARRTRVMKVPDACLMTPLQTQGHSMMPRGGRPGITAVGCFKPRHRENQASYPDVFTGGPPVFQKRLVQMAGLVSETIRWEKMRKFKKVKNIGCNGSQGSV